MLKQHPLKIAGLVKDLLKGGPLRLDGWWRSAIEQRSIDASGAPVPWLTYGAIDFLVERLPAGVSVFEYGCGDGTLWWATTAELVVSVEHDQSWYERVEAQLPENAELLLRDLDLNYVNSISEAGIDFDVVVVDGRKRSECINAAANCLSKSGLIILDNSERKAYRESVDRLLETGFREVFFTGFCPVVNVKSQTSLLYRPHNLLGL